MSDIVTIELDHTLEELRKDLVYFGERDIWFQLVTLNGAGAGGHMPIIILRGEREKVREYVREVYCGGERSWGSTPANIASLDAEVKFLMGEDEADLHEAADISGKE